MKYVYECHEHHQVTVEEPLPSTAFCNRRRAISSSRCGERFELMETYEDQPRTTVDEAQGWYLSLIKAVDSKSSTNIMAAQVGALSWLLKQQGAEVKERARRGL